MLSYKEMTFCSRCDCIEKECFRHQIHIDKEEVWYMGVPVAVGDFYLTCLEFKTENTNEDKD